MGKEGRARSLWTTFKDLLAFERGRRGNLRDTTAKQFCRKKKKWEEVQEQMICFELKGKRFTVIREKEEKKDRTQYDDWTLYGKLSAGHYRLGSFGNACLPFSFSTRLSNYIYAKRGVIHVRTVTPQVTRNLFFSFSLQKTQNSGQSQMVNKTMYDSFKNDYLP